VFFKSPDGAFRGVVAVAVAVGRNQMILHVIGSEKMLQSGQCLIVESLKFWFETLGSEFLMDVIICLDPF
jgi:multisubunit Na+/H+ antiporter MnhB subunit